MYQRGQNYYKNLFTEIKFLEAMNCVITTNTLCIQLEKARKRPQKYYNKNCFRELFCNNFGQDGKGVRVPIGVSGGGVWGRVQVGGGGWFSCGFLGKGEGGGEVG